MHLTVFSSNDQLVNVEVRSKQLLGNLVDPSPKYLACNNQFVLATVLPHTECWRGARRLMAT
jgi:hypothetical protein